MQSKGQSRRCERRQNYATAVNTEVNMPTPAPRSDIGRGRRQCRTNESRTFKRISVRNGSCSYVLSNHARVANASLPALKVIQFWVRREQHGGRGIPARKA